MAPAFAFILWCVCSLSCALAIDTAKWHGRSIYFIVTDRFARTDEADDFASPCDGKEWCGGTLRGVQRKLDYIQGMGFDAIWITPVVKQVHWRDAWNGTAYHGYWAADFMQIDPHLGTEADLLALKEACGRRGMLLMVDVVANHVGPIDHFGHVRMLTSPLNSPICEQFHLLGLEANETCESYIKHPVTIQDAGPGCWPYYNFDIGCNYTIILDGWFGDLADLNQENPHVRNHLLQWIRYMAHHYGIDGFRLDTAMYMPKWFLKAFQEAAGVYMIGEIVTHSMSVHRSFAPPLSGLLNFPIANHINGIFSTAGSLSDLEGLLRKQTAAGYPDANLLGNFFDNHDGKRFLYRHNGDVHQLKNSLAWTLLYHGLPIVYYGTEQVGVSNKTDERTSMWPHYGTTDIYDFMTKLHTLRRDHGLAHGGRAATSPAVIIAAGNNYFAFVRGDLLVLISNQGAGFYLAVDIMRDSFPAAWSDACIHGVRTVMGDVPEPDCRGGDHMHLQIRGGLPSVFALSSHSQVV